MRFRPEGSAVCQRGATPQVEKQEKTPSPNAVKHFCEAFLVMEWWSDCLHSTRPATKNVREAGTLRLRPGWADTTSAGAVRPRNLADDSQRPGGPTHKKGEASQLVSAFQAFDSTQRFFQGPYSTGKGCVGLPCLNPSNAPDSSCINTI